MFNYLLSTSSNQFQTLSIAIMFLVVAVIMCVLGLLFYFYSKFYTKCIKNNLENENLKKYLVRDNKKFFQNIESVVNSSTLTKEQKLQNEISVEKYLQNKEQKKEKSKWINITITCVIYGIFAILIILLIFFKLNSQLIFIGNKTNIIIMTDSMETAYEGNTYLSENNLKNQIASHSLIKIEKIKSQEDVKLYDIVAYKDNENRTIVHRIVDISIVDGETVYTCRGDANNASATFERNMTFERLLGKYTGYQNYALGVLLTFLKSGIGIITIATAFITIGVFEYFEKQIYVVMFNKQKELALQIDKDILLAIKQEQSIVFVQNEVKTKKSNETNNSK